MERWYEIVDISDKPALLLGNFWNFIEFYGIKFPNNWVWPQSSNITSFWTFGFASGLILFSCSKILFLHWHKYSALNWQPKPQDKYITIFIIRLTTTAGLIGMIRMYRNDCFTLSSSSSIATSTTNGKKHDQSTK